MMRDDRMLEKTGATAKGDTPSLVQPVVDVNFGFLNYSAAIALNKWQCNRSGIIISANKSKAFFDSNACRPADTGACE